MILRPLGQDKAWDTLTFIKDKLPPALLFIGPSGVGKKMSAVALFALINCKSPNKNEPCGTCVSCVQIKEGRHPDFIVIGPSGKQILVDDLREIKKTVYFAPFESSVRIIVIDNAHTMNTSSANSILKLIEEPPPHTRFIFVTHERQRLLPTILSRTQSVYFQALSQDILDRVLRERSVEVPADIRPLFFDLLAGGVSRIDELNDPENLELLSRLTVKQDWVTLADKLGTDEDKLALYLDAVVILFRQRSMRPGLDHAAQNAFAKRILEVSHLRSRLERNANKKLVALAAAQLGSIL